MEKTKPNKVDPQSRELHASGKQAPLARVLRPATFAVFCCPDLGCSRPGKPVGDASEDVEGSESRIQTTGSMPMLDSCNLRARIAINIGSTSQLAYFFPVPVPKTHPVGGFCKLGQRAVITFTAYEYIGCTRHFVLKLARQEPARVDRSPSDCSRCTSVHATVSAPTQNIHNSVSRKTTGAASATEGVE